MYEKDTKQNQKSPMETTVIIIQILELESQALANANFITVKFACSNAMLYLANFCEVLLPSELKFISQMFFLNLDFS